MNNMDESTYAQSLIFNLISLIFYFSFSMAFICLEIQAIITSKSYAFTLILLLGVAVLLFMHGIKILKRIITIIKSIKETKKVNIYIRNVGQAIIGIAILAFMFKYFIRFTTSDLFFKLILLGFIIGIILNAIDRIMEWLKIDTVIIKIDKSDE